jgi:hypothetical protein
MGGPLILAASFIGYIKLELITKEDLKELAEATLPKKLNRLIDHLVGEFRIG